jgi:hypothetical protein
VTAAAGLQPINHNWISSAKTQICTIQLGRVKLTGAEAICWLSGVANSAICRCFWATAASCANAGTIVWRCCHRTAGQPR